MRKLWPFLLALGAVAVALLLYLRVGGRTQRDPSVDLDPAATVPAPSSPTDPADEAHQGFLYGRVATDDGTTFEGRLRFGGEEEAFWSDYFNGFKDENPWAAHVPPEALEERRPIEVFGVKVAERTRQVDLRRPFMARFGDIERIEARASDLRVTLKSGTVVELDRLSADDFADGVRIWDQRGGVHDFTEWQIRSIELLPTPRLSAAPKRLAGTVRTRHGDFAGSIQWNRMDCVATDTLDGRSADGELALPFGSIRSISTDSANGSIVTLDDGREIALAGSHEVGPGNRGLYVDDPRYGRVLIPWEAFERVDFAAGGSGPGYGDFSPGRPLSGRVTTRNGRRPAGRLVYDLDESETTDTLDAPSRGVNYTIPFGSIASIVAPGVEGSDARVALRGGEELELEPAGDLGAGNAGILIFGDDRARPDFVRWADVERIDFEER